MWLTTADPFAPTPGSGGFQSESYLSGIREAAKTAFNLERIENFFLTIENKSKELNTTLTANIAGISGQYNKLLQDTYLKNIELGFAYDDVSKLLTAIQTQTSKMTPATELNMKNMLVLGKVLGDSPENIGKMIGGFTELGFSQQKSVNILNKTVAIAKSFGVDAKKLTATVNENIKLAQTYGFKGGIEGLTKMAAQAQRLGTEIKNAVTVADKILDGGPEEAIKIANELQALGGNIGALGDAGQLIHMAMYDMEGLQDQITKASAASVEFNSATGEFKLSGEEMLRLRKQAGVLQLDYKELSKSAINLRKEQEIMSRVPLFKNLSEEQQNLVASLAEIGPGGKVTLDIPGLPKGDLSTMIASDLTAALDKFQADAKETDPATLQEKMLDSAKDSLSVQKKMELSLDAIKNQGIKTLQEKGTGDVILQNIAKQTLPTSTAVGKVVTNIDTQMSGISTHVESFFSSLSNVTSNVVKISNSLANVAAAALKTTMVNTPTPTDTGRIYVTASDAFIPKGGKSMVKTGFGQILPDLNDEMLFSPGISDFFSKYNESENRLKEIGMPKGGDLSMMYKNASASPTMELKNLSGDLSMMYKNASASPTMELTNLMGKLQTSTGPTEVKQTVEIGGKTEVTLNINTNIPQNLISQVLDASELKNTIMETINFRLSKKFSEKLSTV